MHAEEQYIPDAFQVAVLMERRPGVTRWQPFSWTAVGLLAGEVAASGQDEPAPMPAETGPLAQMIMARDPLFTDLVGREGSNAFTRQLARLVRTTKLIPAMETWLAEMSAEGAFYRQTGEILEGQGYGLTDVPRGANGHWVKISDGRISHYQVNFGR